VLHLAAASFALSEPKYFPHPCNGGRNETKPV
jgi:hypothetical protein